MRFLYLLSLLALLGCQTSSHATPRAPAAAPRPEALVGTWKIDLRPTPDAEAYYKDFVVTSVEDHNFEGSFYDSEIQHGRINTSWGALHFSFVTSDGVGEYHTSGVIDGETVRGTTHSIGRKFLSVWTGTRVR